MIDADFKELARKTASDKDLRNKALNIAKNMMDIKEDLLLWFINFLMEKPQVVVLIIKFKKTSNCLKNYLNQLLKFFEKEEFVLH